MFLIDQTKAMAFTLPYQAYDQARKEWSFNQMDLSARFDSLIQQIAERAG